MAPHVLIEKHFSDRHSIDIQLENRHLINRHFTYKHLVKTFDQKQILADKSMLNVDKQIVIIVSVVMLCLIVVLFAIMLNVDIQNVITLSHVMLSILL